MQEMLDEEDGQEVELRRERKLKNELFLPVRLKGKSSEMEGNGSELPDEPRKRMSCGIDFVSVHRLNEILGAATNFYHYHFIVIPFIHPRYRRELISGKCKQREEPLSRSDLVLTSQEWNRLIVGKLSSYLEVDSEIEHVRKQSEAQLVQELEFASHLSLPAIMLKLKHGNNLNLARILYSKLSVHGPFLVWVHIPMTSQRKVNCIETEDPWEWWNRFRSHCDFDKKIGLALELSNHFPTESELDRWIGEPVKCLVIHTKLFFTNHRGYPVLSRPHQEIIRKFMQIDVQYVITGKSKHGCESQYCNYINFLGKKLYANDEFSEYIQGCEDLLQNPLQPLSENLETLVYEVFEKDPHKYNQYQLAIQKALEDKKNSDTEIVVMIVGAGRGPLIRAVLNAHEIVGCNVKLYALEKNPHAINTLRSLVRELWPGKVTILAGDMRSFDPDTKVDILVSELLGSFGDNELSPECLDGAQRFLKSDGVSIPQSYTSWVAPVQSLKLLSEIKATRPADKTIQTCLETPYVVHIVNNYKIDNSKVLFTFHHPNKDEIFDNKRYGTLKFKSSKNCVLTGFAGYFTCDLYKGIMLSTEPRTHTKDMMSWFPIYFPICEPVQIKADDTIEVAFWRCVSEHKVWYEWAVVQPKLGPISNPSGRSYTISK